MKRIFWLVQFFFIVLVTLPLALLPYRLALRLGGLLGELLFYAWAGRRRIAVDNLKGAVSRGAVSLDHSPEFTIKQHFRNLGKSFIEIVKIYYGLGGRIFRNIEIRGLEHFTRALEKGSGIILITGHCGNWELNALACSARLTNINIVARKINNPFLNRLVEATRKTYGNKVIYKKGALKEILSALKRNEAVGILMDQSVIASEGIAADFLGKRDYIMKTPALIAMKTGCSVIPAFIRRTETGHIIQAGKEIELDKSGDGERALINNTVAFSRCIEDFIRENPSEWLWIHRRWKRIKEQDSRPLLAVSEGKANIKP